MFVSVVQFPEGNLQVDFHKTSEDAYKHLCCIIIEEVQFNNQLLMGNETSLMADFIKNKEWEEAVDLFTLTNEYNMFVKSSEKIEPVKEPVW